MLYKKNKQMEPTTDVRHVAKTHFIIFARQFIEEFSAYFEDCLATQEVKIKFLAVFNDVPIGVDHEQYTELLYEFTEVGDALVTKMLTNFGNFIKPYKPYLENRDDSVWHILCTLPQAQNNLIQQLDIAGKWDECDEDTQTVIWEYIDTLVHYGSMFTMYGKIPDDMMSMLNTCAIDVIKEQMTDGEPITEERIKSSLSEIAPKIMNAIKPEDIAQFGMKMLQNPSMLKDLAGMAGNVESIMPGINVGSVVENLIPGGFEGLGDLAGSVAPPTEEQMAAAQSMLMGMLGGTK